MKFDGRDDIRRYVSWRWSHLLRQLERRLRIAIGESALPEGAAVLDLGCADRPYRHLLPAHARYVGADLDGNPVADLAIGADGRVPAADAGFDLVLSTQVLEHVDDPRVYLAEAWRCLRPGGRLLLSTHGIFKYHPDPQDLWRWTHAGLTRTVELAGFRVESVNGVVHAVPAAVQYAADHVGKTWPKPLHYAFHGAVQLLVRLLDALCSDASRKVDALIFVVQARKPGGT